MDLFMYLWCIKISECRWTHPLIHVCKSHSEHICEMLFMYYNLRHSLKAITSRLLNIIMLCNPGTLSHQHKVSMPESPNCITVQQCRRGRDSNYGKMHLHTWKWQQHANNTAINQLHYMTQFPASQIAVNVDVPDFEQRLETLLLGLQDRHCCLMLNQEFMDPADPSLQLANR